MLTALVTMGAAFLVSAQIVDFPPPPPPPTPSYPVISVHPAEIWSCNRPEATGRLPKQVVYTRSGKGLYQNPFYPWTVVYDDGKVVIATLPFILASPSKVDVADATTIVINRQTGRMAVVNVAHPSETALAGTCTRGLAGY